MVGTAAGQGWLAEGGGGDGEQERSHSVGRVGQGTALRPPTTSPSNPMGLPRSSRPWQGSQGSKRQGESSGVLSKMHHRSDRQQVNSVNRMSHPGVQTTREWSPAERFVSGPAPMTCATRPPVDVQSVLCDATSLRHRSQKKRRPMQCIDSGGSPCRAV
jgi:hypothetical protein